MSFGVTVSSISDFLFIEGVERPLYLTLKTTTILVSPVMFLVVPKKFQTGVFEPLNALFLELSYFTSVGGFLFFKLDPIELQ